MKIKYIGQFADGTVLDMETGLRYPWKKDIAIEVQDKFGARLLSEQTEGNAMWVSADDNKSK